MGNISTHTFLIGTATLKERVNIPGNYSTGRVPTADERRAGSFKNLSRVYSFASLSFGWIADG